MTFISNFYLSLLLVVIILNESSYSRFSPQADIVAECSKFTSKPRFNQDDLVSQYSVSGLALAKFSAYLEYDPPLGDIQLDFWKSGITTTRYYYPMDLKSVYLSTEGDSKGPKDLILSTGCGIVTLSLDILPIKRMQVKKFTVSIKNDKSQSKYKCGNSTFISNYITSHFSCYDMKTLRCDNDNHSSYYNSYRYDKSNGQFSLVIRALEFEVMGDANLLKRGNFSRPAEEC